MSKKCNICNKDFASFQSLCNHKKIFHNNIITNNFINNNKQESQPIKIYKCSKCDKTYKHFQSKWRHEIKCNGKTKETNIEQQLSLINDRINKLESKPNIINYNNNNSKNIQNIIIASQPGMESIDQFTSKDRKVIMEKGLHSLMYLIQETNFNKNNQKDQSYCVTSANDKYASVVDTKTNTVIKTEKLELFDKVLDGNIKKLELFSGDRSFGYQEKKQYKNNIQQLKHILFTTKKGMKKYYNEINLLSYNNRELVLETWNCLKKLEEVIDKDLSNIDNTNIDKIDEQTYELSDTESDDMIDSKKLKYFQQKYLDKGTNDSELQTTFLDNEPNNKPKRKPLIEIQSSDSECYSDDEEVSQIFYKNKMFFVLDDKLYLKNPNGTRGEYYGTYINGKVKRD